MIDPLRQSCRCAWIALITGLTANFAPPSGHGQVAQSGLPSGAASVLWTNSVGMRFVRLPAGAFAMGSPLNEIDRADNETRHQVRLTHGFLLAATLVTVDQFRQFVAATGYRTVAERRGGSLGAWDTKRNRWEPRPGASWRDPGFVQTGNHPVVCVDWHDAVGFCAWLAAKEHRRYRLPTEAEWEYACRAGAQTAFPWGDRPADGAGWANGADFTARDIFNLFPPFTWSDGYLYTSPVGTFRANAWGLFDMIGNVLEWCEDWYGPYAVPDSASAALADPTGPTAGREKILRGGAFVYGPARSRSAFRGRNYPEFDNFYVGFRVALDASP